MTINAERVGRDLHITVEGAGDPYVVRPLPGRAGEQITDTYLHTAGRTEGLSMSDALIMAVDGARQNAITGLWEPVPEDEQTNYKRIGLELSQAEAEEVLMPAFFWQTILGMDGVRAYIEAGQGLAGSLKAVGALTARLGLSARLTSPRTA